MEENTIGCGMAFTSIKLRKNYVRVFSELFRKDILLPATGGHRTSGKG